MALMNPDRVAVAFVVLDDGRHICVTKSLDGFHPWRIFMGQGDNAELRELHIEGKCDVYYYPCEVDSCPPDTRDTVHSHRKLGIYTVVGSLWLPGDCGGVPAHWQDLGGSKHAATVIEPDFDYMEIGSIMTVFATIGA